MTPQGARVRIGKCLYRDWSGGLWGTGHDRQSLMAPEGPWSGPSNSIYFRYTPEGNSERPGPASTIAGQPAASRLPGATASARRLRRGTRASGSGGEAPTDRPGGTPSEGCAIRGGHASPSRLTLTLTRSRRYPPAPDHPTSATGSASSRPLWPQRPRRLSRAWDRRRSCRSMCRARDRW